MVTYPIHVRRDGYRGKDPRKRLRADTTNRIASELEKHINKLLKEQQEPITSYDYHTIARATGHDAETVRTLCFSIDCGHNGFTAVKHGLSFDEAWDMSHPKDK